MLPFFNGKGNVYNAIIWIYALKHFIDYKFKSNDLKSEQHQQRSQSL